MQAGFLHEATKLNQLCFCLKLEDINSDVRAANYLQHMAYSDEIFLRRNELESKRAEYLAEGNLLKLF